LKFVIGVVKIINVMSPQIIIFMELLYNWLRMGSNELHTKKFPVGEL